MALRSQGVPIHIVYLGHRYGSSVVVRKDGPVHTVADLAGRKVAIPNRFSDERLLLIRALKQNHVDLSKVQMLEMNPPDVPGALATGSSTRFPWGSRSLRRPRSMAMEGCCFRPRIIGRIIFPACWWCATT